MHTGLCLHASLHLDVLADFCKQFLFQSFMCGYCKVWCQKYHAMLLLLLISQLLIA